jgi:hypothetical protein
LLALLGAHPILHVSRIRVKYLGQNVRQQKLFEKRKKLEKDLKSNVITMKVVANTYVTLEAVSQKRNVK